MLITYPARPLDGGPMQHALPKPGVWFVEPKINDWRAMVHVPSLTMFNRQGEPFSIADKFTPALERLKNLPFEWLDVLALERRHSIGRGSLILMDWIFPKIGTGCDYVFRRKQLELECLSESIPKHSPLNEKIASNSVLLMPSFKAVEAANLYTHLQRCNKELGEEFYEGVVMKKGSAPYPAQLRDPDLKTAYWVKHRWHF